MTDTEKAEKVEALAEEVEKLSEELSEDELEQVAGGAACNCTGSGYGGATDKGGRCTCSALGAGTTVADSSDPDHLRCACSGSGSGGETAGPGCALPGMIAAAGGNAGSGGGGGTACTMLSIL
ncbi:MAG: hypothetical protein LBL86_06790 [Coriobacteriales bacterium]|jgi:natural product precursor|nr:hypothetical protein [Coriobacteriales bacterium]